MKTLETLSRGDYVAFEWTYGIFGPTIIVDTITEVYDDQVLVHFLYGYKSEAEFVKKNDIIAIGDLHHGSAKIKGWGGKYHLLKPEHPLLKR